MTWAKLTQPDAKPDFNASAFMFMVRNLADAHNCSSGEKWSNGWDDDKEHRGPGCYGADSLQTILIFLFSITGAVALAGLAYCYFYRPTNNTNAPQIQQALLVAPQESHQEHNEVDSQQIEHGAFRRDLEEGRAGMEEIARSAKGDIRLYAQFGLLSTANPLQQEGMTGAQNLDLPHAIAVAAEAKPSI